MFTALATSLSAGAEATFSADKAQALSGEIKHALSENAATIERTQTINILREAMFRNCERYLSGAVSTDEFIVQAARDQRAMVHILAIEQITGVARAQSTALTTLAKATDAGTTEETIKLLDGARQREADAKKASAAAAKAAFDQAPEGECASAPKAASGAVTDAQIKEKKAKCDAADGAAAAHKEAAAYQATLATALQRQGEALVAAWGAASSAHNNAPAAGREIAQTVLEIVRQSDDFNEIEMTCVVRLRNGLKIGDGDKEFYDACLGLVKQLAQTQRAKAESEEAEYNALVSKFQSAYQKGIADQSDMLWAYFGQGSKLDAVRLDALAAKAGVPLAHTDRLDFLAVKSLSDMRVVVAKLTTSEANRLAEATR
ncbi:hypothetical protein DX914_12675 [Lysobacter silvisoli]|uniref:Uncharacterized protein n=1 Tax=Lysobacter silvisoli TaxID=2293254 RepID=A0A371JZT1_9GAMM|nr:hypothetical protein DX914_12675 [Lysobacter silvisoli]